MASGALAKNRKGSEKFYVRFKGASPGLYEAITGIRESLISGVIKIHLFSFQCNLEASCEGVISFLH